MGYMSHIDKDAMKVLKEYQSWQEERESLRKELAAKDAELEERNNVMHRAVEDAESLRDRLEKAEKERDEALKASNAQFAENEELDKGREYQLAEITLLQRDLETAEARVRELEERHKFPIEKIFDGLSRHCDTCEGYALDRKMLCKRIKELEENIVGLTTQRTELFNANVAKDKRIKALVEAGDLYQLDHDAEARRKSSMGLSTDKCLCHRCRKWDKAKGEAVPYNDGAR